MNLIHPIEPGWLHTNDALSRPEERERRRRRRQQIRQRRDLKEQEEGQAPHVFGQAARVLDLVA